MSAQTDEEERRCEDSEKVAIHTTKGEASEETKHVTSLILYFQHPEMWEDTFLLFKARPPIHDILLWQP